MSAQNRAKRSRKTAHINVSVEDLRRVIDYDPTTGKMVWKERKDSGRGAARAGKEAGCISCGYRTVHVLGRKTYAHRIAFALTHGRWPQPMCDHINGNRLDNRACNLREATRAQNLRNSRKKVGASGIKGVNKSKNGKKWEARVSCGGQKYHKTFDTIEEAAAAARMARERLHGQFARH